MRVGRVGLVAILAVSLATPLAVPAQERTKVWRIGFLQTGPATGTRYRDVFQHGLRELGYLEGQNVVIESRYAEGKLDRLDGLAGELVRSKVDVIVTTGTQTTVAAKRATSVTPIVMALSGDAVGTGLIASLARPGGNVTGLTYIAPELAGKRLEVLKELVPLLSRVAVLWNPEDPPRRLEYKEAESAARTLGLVLQSVEIRHADEIDGAFAAMARRRPEALVVFNDPLTNVSRRPIVGAAARSGLPVMSGLREFAESGALASYGPSFSELVRRAATFVDKIFKGAKPAGLPVEQPTKFELVINLKTAKTLGLAIPPSLLLRADELIQ
jgi:putative tryptophan/tyrosine transport system substrate-binding protein